MNHSRMRLNCDRSTPIGGGKGVNPHWEMRPQGEVRGSKRTDQILFDRATASGYRRVTVNCIRSFTDHTVPGKPIGVVRGKVGVQRVQLLQGEVWEKK